MNSALKAVVNTLLITSAAREGALQGDSADAVLYAEPAAKEGRTGIGF